jgi:two-component system OmpR family sensor kinase
MTSLSLRIRLLLAVGIVALVALVLADVTVYTSLKSYLYRQVDATLQVSGQSVKAAVSGPGAENPPSTGSSPMPAQTPSGADFCAMGREIAPGMYVEIVSATDTVVSGDACPAFTPGSTSYTPQLTAIVRSLLRTTTKAAGSATYFTVAATRADGPAFRVQAEQLQGGEVLIVADPLSGISSTLDRLLFLELVVTGAALAISVLVGLWLVRLGLRPLRDVVRTAEAITEGDLVHRVPNANARTEIGRVAEALNVMLARIETGFADLQASESRLRRFVADASHELRTPIAAVSAYAQLFQFGAQDGDELGRVMSGIEHETGRMSRLVEDLLVLARFDEQRSLEPELVELVGVAMEAVATARMVGPQWPLAVEAGDVVEVIGDPMALRQVIDNLLKNVRAHTPLGTAATVRVGRVDDHAVIEVEDAGPGLTDVDAALVFERFFRSDPSRSRDTGGAGLGLAIVAAIVKSHGGRVTVERGRQGGALFRVMVPLLSTGSPAPVSVLSGSAGS